MSCWPLPQQLLPVSAAGSGRRCCSGNIILDFANPAGLWPRRICFFTGGVAEGSSIHPRQKTFFCRFKKQGSAPVFGFIFRFVKRVQLFICFFETFSAFSLLSNPPESFIIIKRSAAISRPVCKNGNPGSSQSVLAARPLCGVAGRFRLFQIL